MKMHRFTLKIYRSATNTPREAQTTQLALREAQTTH